MPATTGHVEALLDAITMNRSSQAAKVNLWP